jgi:hypothetical protein
VAQREPSPPTAAHPLGDAAVGAKEFGPAWHTKFGVRKSPGLYFEMDLLRSYLLFQQGEECAHWCLRYLAVLAEWKGVCRSVTVRILFVVIGRVPDRR